MSTDEQLILIIFTIVSLIPTLAVWVVLYIFNALGISALAKNRGYLKPWLAWIPFARSYLMGSLSDNINSYQNKKSAHRIWCLLTDIFSTCVMVIANVFIFSFMFSKDFTSLVLNDTYTEEIFRMMIPLVLLSLAYSLLQLIKVIFFSISQYRIFVDYIPNNAVLYLVLGIIFQIAPFFLFSIRKKPSYSIYYAQQQQQTNATYQQPINSQS